MIDKKNSITAIILTFNEEKHIRRCLNSLNGLVDDIVIVDSFSDDNTINIINENKKIRIFQNYFINQGKQINWAIKNIEFKTNWIFRIDADEIASEVLKKDILNNLDSISKTYNGISIIRKLKFFNKEIAFGGQFPHKTLRFWKKNKGRSQEIWLDEQLEVDGDIYFSNAYITDENLNKLSWWVNKHKKYAEREAISYYLYKNKKEELNYNKNEAQKNKIYKYKIYYRLPIFLRPILLFVYNYLIKLGFLSSWQGLVYYLIQMIWLRMMTDIFIFKINKKMKKNKMNLKEVVKLSFYRDI